MKKIGIIVFIAAIILGVVVSSFFSFGRLSERVFNFSFSSGTAGSGNLATETRDVSGFTGVDAGGVFQVEIAAQEEFGIEIEADDNLLPLIKTEVRSGVLHIESEEKISPKNTIRVRISAPDIQSIEASGASKVSLNSLKNSVLKIDTSGASKVLINGETASLTINVSGASKVDAENLKAENATIDASGASHASVFVSGRLNADASGASRIIYSGNPKNIEKKSSGASSVKEN